MSNPISSIPGAQIPPITEKLIDSNGAATTTYYRFLTGLYLRTGGATGISAGDAAQVANQALTIATQANQQAQHATSEAQEALSDIATLEPQVQLAIDTANHAVTQTGTTQATALQRLLNLGDLTDVRSARVNIGLEQIPFLYQFDTLPSGLRRGVPSIYPGRFEANLAGTLVWWDVATTNDAVFTVRYVRSGVSTLIGTITLAHSGTGVQFSLQPAVNLLVGDIVVVQTPTVIDATLARVAITIPLSL